MRFATVSGRFVVMTDDGAFDLHDSSRGELPWQPISCLERWDDVLSWTERADPAHWVRAVGELGAPVPCPRQVFAIGMNYVDHVSESGAETPRFPSTFTKFPSSIVGHDVVVDLPSEKVDWEVELVVVIGRHARDVAEADGLAHVGGFTVGQDVSERAIQWRKPLPQFSLGKSFPGFAPTGPSMVTLDDLDDPADLRIECRLNGALVQSGSTADLVFSVPRLVAELSAVVQLWPGDLIFTGTPAGVGATRTPPQFLAPGDVLESSISGIGVLRTRFAAGRAHPSFNGRSRVPANHHQEH